MAIYDNLPYTNFHELNADWLLKQMMEAKAKVDDMQAEIDQFNADYAALAAAFTIAGSNISTTKNFSAASLTGPLTGNVTGDLTGNVTGNVTGDVTGDLTGNVTGGSFQGSYVEATNGQITHNLTVGNDAEIFNNLTVDGTIFGNVTGNVSGNAATATTASGAATLSLDTSVTSQDMNDYYNTTRSLTLYRIASADNNAPTGMGGEAAIILYWGEIGASYGLQFAWFSQLDSDIFVRHLYGGAWQSWKKLTLGNV